MAIPYHALFHQCSSTCSRGPSALFAACADTWCWINLLLLSPRLPFPTSAVAYSFPRVSSRTQIDFPLRCPRQRQQGRHWRCQRPRHCRPYRSLPRRWLAQSTPSWIASWRTLDRIDQYHSLTGTLCQHSLKFIPLCSSGVTARATLTRANRLMRVNFILTGRLWLLMDIKE